MSRTYSSWRSLSSPNIRSSSTSEKPITAFSGVRSSCDIEARNSDLCRPATSSSRKSCTFWIAIAPWAANVLISVERAIAELVDVLAPQRDDADDLVARQHRHAEHRPEAAELARLVHLVVGVGEHVADLDGAPLEPDAADQRPGAARDRDAGQVVAIGLRPADRQREPVHVLVEHVDLAGVGVAEPDGLLQHGLEHRLELERGAPDELQHLVGRRLALARLGQRPLELLDPVHPATLSRSPTRSSRRRRRASRR